MKLNLIFLLILATNTACQSKLIPLPIINSHNTEQYNILVEKLKTNDYRNDAENFAKQGFKEGATVFVGSSTFTILADLESIFAHYNALNRGIGGSSINHIIAHSENLIFGNNPRVVVLYIGDNDAYSMPIEDFKSYLDCFTINFRQRFVESDLIFISVKPSPSRADKHRTYLQINETYKKYASLDPRISYVDIWTPISTSTMPEQYFYDNLHLNSAGYKILIDSLTPVLNRIYLKQ